MNKLEMKNNVLTANLSSNITYEYSKNELVNSLSIKILKSTTLHLYNSKDVKLNISIDILPNVDFKLFVYRTPGNYKIQTKYFLKENSRITVTKINDGYKIVEREVFFLEDEKSSVDYLLKTISTDEEKYDVSVYHKHANTNSNIIMNGINIEDGKLKHTVTTYIPKGIKNCIANQDSRIINLNNNKCVIRPNLLIDEYDCLANHSAHIGKFSDEELFYLKRLGLDNEKALYLLTMGFLRSKLTDFDVIDKVINKYWR